MTKKTSVRFPTSSGFFSRVSPQKSSLFPTKEDEKEIFNTRESKNTITTTTTTTTGAPSSLRKDEYRRGEERRSRFFRRATDAMIGDHDGYKWRKYGQKNIKSAVFEKLLPIAASRLSREETGRKRRRKVRKRTQSREAKLAATQKTDCTAQNLGRSRRRK